MTAHAKARAPDGTRAFVRTGQRVLTRALVLGDTLAVSDGTNVAV